MTNTRAIIQGGILTAQRRDRPGEPYIYKPRKRHGKSDVEHIYGLTDPRTSKVRYVGCSAAPKKRLSMIIGKARRGYEQHRPLLAWCKELIDQKKPQLVVLVSVPKKDSAVLEAALINTFAQYGDLLNLIHGNDERG